MTNAELETEAHRSSKVSASSCVQDGTVSQWDDADDSNVVSSKYDCLLNGETSSAL